MHMQKPEDCLQMHQDVRLTHTLAKSSIIFYCVAGYSRVDGSGPRKTIWWCWFYTVGQKSETKAEIKTLLFMLALLQHRNKTHDWTEQWHLIISCFLIVTATDFYFHAFFYFYLMDKLLHSKFMLKIKFKIHRLCLYLLSTFRHNRLPIIVFNCW